MIVLGLALYFWVARSSGTDSGTKQAVTSSKGAPDQAAASTGTVTHIYAHNLRLHQGPDFRVYILWLRGDLVRTKKNEIPSFDDQDSFYLNITTGVMRANLGDIGNYLNEKLHGGALTDVVIRGTGQQVKITGKFHKVVPLPIQLIGTVSPASGNRIQIHVAKIDVLKIPFKWLLKSVHVSLADMVGTGKIPGVDINGNDIFLYPEQLLPPPHIQGTLTGVSLGTPDLELVYGNAAKDVQKVEQWRNFLRLRDGTLDFGKLTMHNVDLMMIDISQDAWFDLDLANYQAQLVNGYTRMTPEAGLQIFMPDVSSLKPSTAKDISIQWFKNRKVAPPADVVPRKH